MIPVIISGGSGSRLWPVSRQADPKPFIRRRHKTRYKNRALGRVRLARYDTQYFPLRFAGGWSNKSHQGSKTVHQIAGR